MNVLGLHFGHDGSACVVRDGTIVANILRERRSRGKHALSIEMEAISKALTIAGLALEQLDFVAITSTQSIDLIGAFIPGFSVEPVFGTHPLQRLDEGACVGLPGFDPGLALRPRYVVRLNDPLSTPFIHPADTELFAEFKGLPVEELNAVGFPTAYPGDRLWPEARGFEGLAEKADLEGGALREYGFHLPVTVRLDGHTVPGALVHHHLCHAASTFYRSPFTRAAVFTQDGHSGDYSLNGGGFFWGDGNRLIPITPHYSALGHFYEHVGQLLQLGALGAPGKLMGLAPYGTPRHFHPYLVGNNVDLAERRLFSPAHDFLVRLLRKLLKEGETLAELGQPDFLTHALNADIAASTQLIFEETRLAAVRCFKRILDRLGLRPDGLCLSGGVTLNCPANTRIASEGPFKAVFAEPNCDDGGLAAGAALYLSHHLLDIPVARGKTRPLPPCLTDHLPHPFASVPGASSERILAALEGNRARFRWRHSADAAEEAAQALADNCLVGWVQGPSEVGPRALGRRSLLADPRAGDNWKRVNAVKTREWWRPFAPAVLESAAAEWFDGPLPSPYMLFTARVRHGGLPAITHVDGTARVQTVADNDRPFADLLRAFQRRTGIPIVLNTSLNGRGEPIVETPEEALDLLSRGTMDVLFLGSFRVERI